MRTFFGAAGRYADHPWFQRVWADRRVDLDVFERMHADGRAVLGPAAGLVPRFDELRSSTFDPSRVDSTIRAFYERTSSFDIEVQRLGWKPWASALSLPYGWVASGLGNLRVPASITEARDMDSHIRRIDLGDGGESRAWMRTFSGTRDVFYAATVRVHCTTAESYLSLAFPLPGCHLAVVLRVEHHRGSGVLLTTRRGALAGTYLVAAGAQRFVAVPGPPTSEELAFEPREDGTIVGSHVDRLVGATAFEMDYEIARRPGT